MNRGSRFQRSATEQKIPQNNMKIGHGCCQRCVLIKYCIMSNINECNHLEPLSFRLSFIMRNASDGAQ